MSEAQDPLRSLFQQAGDFGQSRARPASVAHITDRGKRAYRRRLGAVAAGACLIIGCGGAGVVVGLQRAPATVPPAVSPPPAHPSPGPSDRTQPPSPPPSSQPDSPSDTPSIGRTTQSSVSGSATSRGPDDSGSYDPSFR